MTGRGRRRTFILCAIALAVTGVWAATFRPADLPAAFVVDTSSPGSRLLTLDGREVSGWEWDGGKADPWCRQRLLRYLEALEDLGLLERRRVQCSWADLGPERGPTTRTCVRDTLTDPPPPGAPDAALAGVWSIDGDSDYVWDLDVSGRFEERVPGYLVASGTWARNGSVLWTARDPAGSEPSPLRVYVVSDGDSELVSTSWTLRRPPQSPGTPR